MEENLKDIILKEARKQYKERKIRTGLDAENFLDGLIQPILQDLLELELDGHLNYSKYEHQKNKTSDNARNGYCKTKKVETKYGQIELKTPRDRKGTFSPLIVEKGQSKMTGFEEKCVALYAKGMSVRDIEVILTDFYGTKINKDIICNMISKVNEDVIAWRSRRLKSLYVFTYADCLYIPIKDDLTSNKKAVYVIVGVDVEGYKDILGIWIDKTESASFWATVFDDIKNRGVEDILYMCSDGLAGFKGSLEIAFPKTNTQRCVIHMDRNLYKICPKKQSKEVLVDFKKIYSSSSRDAAQLELENFKNKYKDSNPKIVEKVLEFMPLIESLFELPYEIRKAIYTTNAVESVNSALRKVTNGKGSFPNEEAVFKVLFLRIKDLTKKWNKPINNWKIIREQLAEIFGDRYLKHVKM